MVLFRATERSPDMLFFKDETRTNGRGPLATGRLSVIDVPGTHQSLLRPEYAAAAALCYGHISLRKLTNCASDANAQYLPHPLVRDPLGLDM
jgi:hypothetical protein